MSDYKEILKLFFKVINVLKEKKIIKSVLNAS